MLSDSNNPGAWPASFGNMLLRPALVLLLTAATTEVSAHSFGITYTLPVPLSLYNWTASGTLLLSFLMIILAVTGTVKQRAPAQCDLSDKCLSRFLLADATIVILRLVVLGALILCIASAWFGPPNAYLNFSMTFFWIIFVLGFSYFTMLFGGWYHQLNPWGTLARLALPENWRAGRYRYPQRLGVSPALLFYFVFIWFELFGGTAPPTLALLLTSYTVINLCGILLFGARDWLAHAEFFSVLFRLISKMAPLQLSPADTSGSRRRLVLQWPFMGLLRSQAVSISELLFILFMLSSTVFDGVHQTELWLRLFWDDIAGLLQPWLGSNIVHSYPILKPLFGWFQLAALLLSPFIYLGCYWFCVLLMRRLGGGNLSVRQLALRFAYSLLPIALVYHFTHYFTLILSQGGVIKRLASDPLGLGWDLFGTAHWLPTAIYPDMNWVWHIQVGAILLGHIASVYLAHRVALEVFADRRKAVLSQLPMLLLMVGFTCFGLWILALPIGAMAGG